MSDDNGGDLDYEEWLETLSERQRSFLALAECSDSRMCDAVGAAVPSLLGGDYSGVTVAAGNAVVDLYGPLRDACENCDDPNFTLDAVDRVVERAGCLLEGATHAALAVNDYAAWCSLGARFGMVVVVSSAVDELREGKSVDPGDIWDGVGACEDADVEFQLAEPGAWEAAKANLLARGDDLTFVDWAEVLLGIRLAAPLP